MPIVTKIVCLHTTATPVVWFNCHACGVVQLPGEGDSFSLSYLPGVGGSSHVMQLYAHNRCPSVVEIDVDRSRL
jgi:hypothetical protein